MLGVEPGGEPNNRASRESQGIGQELAEMRVVAGPELRFDHHPGAGAAVVAHQVGAEPAHRGFLRHWFQIEPERAAQMGKALGGRKPGDELGRLALPEGGGVDGVEISDRVIGHGGVAPFWVARGAGTKKGRRNLRRPHFA